MFEIEAKDMMTLAQLEQADAEEDARIRAANEKRKAEWRLKNCLRRHAQKEEKRKKWEAKMTKSSELKDWFGSGDIDDDGNPNHDQKKWMFP